MQLSDILELVAREGIRRHVEKRAGVMLPLAVGMMVPGIVHKALERANSTEQTLDHAIGHPFKVATANPWSAVMGHMFGQGASAAGGAAKHTAGSAGRELMGQGTEFGSGGASGLKGSFGQLGASPITGVAQGVSGGIGDLIKRKIMGREYGERKDPLHLGGTAAVMSFGKEMGTSGANLLRDIANKAMEAAGHAGDASAREAIIGDLKKTDTVLANADDATLMEAYHTMSRFAPVLSTDKNAVRSFLRQAVMSGAGPDYMSIKLLADSERAVTGGNDKRAALDLGALLSAAARPALAGAGAGAITGAISDKDDRRGGALRGALTGGAMGGLGGALHGHMTSAPKDQGGLPPKVPNPWRDPGMPGESVRQIWEPGGNTGIRNMPMDAAEFAETLGHRPFGKKVQP